MTSALVQEVHDSALIIDLHCDLLLTSYWLRWDWTRRHRANPLPGAALMGHGDIPRFRQGNLGCIALGIVTTPLRKSSGPSAISSDLDRMERVVQASPDLVIATTPDAIRAARERDQIAVFAGLEGVHGLNGGLDDLAAFQRRGLVYVGLTHFTRNAAAHPMVGWGASAIEGLSDYGHALVDRLQRLGLLVDLAHLNKPGVMEVCARSRAPLLCSHTAANAVHPSARGLDDEQIEAIAATGGVIGVIFATPFIGSGGVGAVAAHMDHIKRRVGVQHCGIGSDWDGWVLYPRELDGADKLPTLTGALLALGWSRADIHAAYGGNFLRVLEQARRQAEA